VTDRSSTSTAPLRSAWRLDRYRQFWDSNLDRLDTHLQEIQERKESDMSDSIGMQEVTSGISITRIFEAPRDLVFKAWTEPKRFAQWFGLNDSSVPIDSISMDVRPGGTWRATMVIPGGGVPGGGAPGDGAAAPEATEIPWKGIYHEVEPPERLVFSLSDQPGDEQEIVTVLLKDLGGKTEMVFHQGGGHLKAEEYEQAKAGWGLFFERLAGHLESA
jgi:uncharacterized protein YndB with AHSA1/START domain